MKFRTTAIFVCLLAVTATTCSLFDEQRDFEVELNVAWNQDLNFEDSTVYGKLSNQYNTGEPLYFPYDPNLNDGKYPRLPECNTAASSEDGAVRRYIDFEIVSNFNLDEFIFNDYFNTNCSGDKSVILYHEHGKWYAKAKVSVSSDIMAKYDLDFLTGGKIEIGSIPSAANPLEPFRIRVTLESQGGNQVYEIATDRLVTDYRFDEPEQLSNPKYSPDGNYIYFAEPCCEPMLMRVPAAGGTAEIVLEQGACSYTPTEQGRTFLIGSEGDEYDTRIYLQSTKDGETNETLYLQSEPFCPGSIRTHRNAHLIAIENNALVYAWDYLFGFHNTSWTYDYGACFRDDARNNELWSLDHYTEAAAFTAGNEFFSEGRLSDYDIYTAEYPLGVSSDGSLLQWRPTLLEPCRGAGCYLEQHERLCSLGLEFLSLTGLYVLVDGEGNINDPAAAKNIIKLDADCDWRLSAMSPAYIVDGQAYFIAIDGREPYGRLSAEGCDKDYILAHTKWSARIVRPHPLDARPVLVRADLETGNVEVITTLASDFRLTDISPDGKSLLLYGKAVSANGVTPEQAKGLWRYDLETGLFIPVLDSHADLMPWTDKFRNSRDPLFWIRL